MKISDTCIIQEELNEMFMNISSKSDLDIFITKCKECLDKHICEEYILYKIEDPEGILHDALKNYYTLDRQCVLTRASKDLIDRINPIIVKKYTNTISKYGINENGDIVILDNH